MSNLYTRPQARFVDVQMNRVKKIPQRNFYFKFIVEIKNDNIDLDLLAVAYVVNAVEWNGIRVSY